MQKKLNYKLEEGIEVAIGGDIETFYEIEFVAPSFQCKKESARISQAMMRGQLALQNKVPQDEETIEKAKQIKEDIDDDEDEFEAKSNLVKMLLLGSDDNFSDVIDAFVKIARKTGRFNEKIKLKEVHLQKLSYNEIENMVCAYVAHFMMPSQFSSKSPKTSI